MSRKNTLSRIASRLLPGATLLLAACSTPPVMQQDMQRYYPDTDQLLSRTSRLLLPDGTPERHGLFESFYPDGHSQERVIYVHGVADGSFQQWHANGTLACKGVYVMGRRTGEWCQWDEHGVLRERSNWRAGLLDGEAGAWDAEGHATWAGHFAHDKRDGTFTAFHPNGQPRVRGNFDAGRPRGRFTAWYADGKRADEGRYTKGEPDGTWVCWDSKGVQLASVSVRAGQPGDVALPAGLAWDASLAPVADPLDLAAAFAQWPSSEEPVLPAVVFEAPRKPAPATVTARSKHAKAIPVKLDGERAGPSQVGVN